MRVQISSQTARQVVSTCPACKAGNVTADNILQYRYVYLRDCPTHGKMWVDAEWRTERKRNGRRRSKYR